MLLVNQHNGFGGFTDASFTPASISGLQLWVRSDLGITKDGSDFVSQWDDQSGNGRNLTEATNKPLWVDAQINGYPCIRFDGTNDSLETANFTVTQPITIFVVIKELAATASDRILDCDSSSSGPTPQLVQRSGPQTIQLQSNSVDGASVGSDVTNYHYYKAIFNGTSSVISKDGGADQTHGNNLAGSVERVTLAAANAGTSSFGNVEFAEVCLYDSSISGTNLTNINSYFASRYGL